MDIKKISGVIFALLVLASIVHAQYDLFSGKFYDIEESQQKIDFEFYNGTYDICENDKKTIPILVANKDNMDNSYKLTASGAGWIGLNVQEFSLPKSQSGVVFLELNPALNTNGKYVIGVTSLSSGNVRKSLNLDVNVEKCRSFALEIQEEDKVCGGIKRQYAGEITNDGKLDSNINLILNGPNWVNADKDFFSIRPGDRENFNLNADIPSNAKGTFNVILNAALENFPSIKSERKLSIDVVPKYDCYRADIIADAKIENEFSNDYRSILVRNSGIKQAIYEITLEAPSWVSIEPKILSVNPGQIANANLNINPRNNIPEDFYPVKINVKFEDIAYSKTINVELAKNKFLKNLKSFFVFYQYYIYLVLAVVALLLIFRRQIVNKIKSSYKAYKIKNSRLKALKSARNARELKRKLRQLEKAEVKTKSRKYNYGRLILFFIGLLVIVGILFFSVYKFDFPVSKELVKNYYAYIIAGILASAFIIFLIEFYKPLFRLFGKIK